VRKHSSRDTRCDQRDQSLDLSRESRDEGVAFCPYGTNSLNPSGTMNKSRLGSLKNHRDSQWVFTGVEKEPIWQE